MKTTSQPRTTFVVMLIVLMSGAGVCAADPLYERIDRAIETQTPNFATMAAPVAGDEEFLRRIYLDLTGTIPTTAEIRAFLQDTSADKRTVAIDRLLNSPEFSRHMALVFDVMLMERRADKHVPRAEWHEYLRKSFADNKGYDQIVREILQADGLDAKLRAPAKFVLDRDAEPHQTTRDVGRLFLGMNFQCAQCHDHPHWRDYKQEQYYGLFAFYNRTSIFTEKDKRVVLAEKAEGDVTYQNVFDAKLQKSALPKVPFGEAIAEPAFEKGKEYDIAPAAGVRPVPKYSRRAQLSDKLAIETNAQFKRNAANRLWAHMMGRGLIHPVDQDHQKNPPSHPELLQLLTEEFAANKFDIKTFLRQLALSKTYQRSSEIPSKVKDVDPATFAVAQMKPLSPEQLAFTLMQATGITDTERKTLGTNLSEPTLYAKLAANVAPFVQTFGGPAGQAENQNFETSLDQVLFLNNGDLVRSWIAPRASNLSGRINTIQQPEDVADELYLSVLTRKPTAEEKQDVIAYFKKRSSARPPAVQELIWALVTSAEFRFNH